MENNPLAEIEELSRAASDAAAKLAAKQAQIKALHSEAETLPKRIEELQLAVAAADVELTRFEDIEILERQFKDAYRSAITEDFFRSHGVSVTDRPIFDEHATRLVTAQLRCEVLREMRADLSAQLDHAKKRQREVARLLSKQS